MTNKILDFFKSLFSTTSNTDEKIVVGFCSFAVMVFIAVVTLFSTYDIPFEMFLTFASLTFACFGLGTIANVKAMSVKSSVASDIAKANSSQQTNEAAKDIVQSDKPQ